MSIDLGHRWGVRNGPVRFFGLDALAADFELRAIGERILHGLSRFAQEARDFDQRPMPMRVFTRPGAQFRIDNIAPAPEPERPRYVRHYVQEPVR